MNQTDATEPQPAEPQKITMERKGPEEGQVLGMTYNFSGPVEVVWRGGKKVSEQQPKAVDPDWEKKFLKLKPHHTKAFRIIMELLAQRKQRKIEVPIFMNEMKQYAQKQTIKDLEKAGLIEIKLARFQKDGKLAEAVNVMWLSGAGEILGKRAREAQVAAETEGTGGTD